MSFTIFQEDLEYIHKNISLFLPKLQDKHVFITGANGFFGIWLIESLLYLNSKKNLGMKIYALSRSKESFYNKFPHLKSFDKLEITEGNVLDYKDDFQQLDYIIHAANLPFDNTDDWATRHINYGIVGTQNLFETAKKHSVQSILLTSSGAVYRNFHADIPFREEALQVDCSYASVYAQTKKIAEQLAKDFSERENIPCTIARCFAFAGAHLPLESFAFGEFIKNAILGQDIIIKSSGQATRSYLYAADLVVYLLSMLIKASNFQVYNVGSDKTTSLKELAKSIGDMYNLQIDILGEEDKGNAPLAYLPSTDKLQETFNFTPSLDLQHCIEKMYEWNKSLNLSKEIYHVSC